ncbi:MAG: endonuclease III [Nitrososphaerota archaeon]|nr:endonuclease III [Nitrososphaerota archaeon]
MRSMVSTGARATALSDLQREEGSDPFRILIGTILSHRTRDENTTRATANLFSVYRTPAELAGADEEEVKRLIRPAGFYNMKAKNVIRVSRQLLDRFGGRVPDNVDDLLTLRSVGRKTANCVMVYAFGKAAIPVDTHVHRISNRLGLVKTKTPDETEERLAAAVPKEHWLELNELFVRFGQTVCRPVGPRCAECSLKRGCAYYRSSAGKASR